MGLGAFVQRRFGTACHIITNCYDILEEVHLLLREE
jgi:hypothetical protein